MNGEASVDPMVPDITIPGIPLSLNALEWCPVGVVPVGLPSWYSVEPGQRWVMSVRLWLPDITIPWYSVEPGNW